VLGTAASGQFTKVAKTATAPGARTAFYVPTLDGSFSLFSPWVSAGRDPGLRGRSVDYVTERRKAALLKGRIPTMERKNLCLRLLALLALVVRALRDRGCSWDSVARVLQTSDAFASGYHRFNLPAAM